MPGVTASLRPLAISLLRLDGDDNIAAVDLVRPPLTADDAQAVPGRHERVCRFLPQKGIPTLPLITGQRTLSATPLAWAHSELIKLPGPG